MEDRKRIIEKAVKKAGSLEALIEKTAKSQNLDDRRLEVSSSDKEDHPSEETLYDYVLGWLENEAAAAVMDHVGLCDHCAEEVLRIRAIEDELREHALTWADQKSWLDRLKSFVSNLSFPIMIQSPALEAVRGPKDKDAVPVMKVGDPLLLYVRVPAEGHIAVFHYVEQSDEVKLIFPDSPSDITKTPAARDVCVLEGVVEGPAGLQTLKVIWTEDSLIDTGMIIQENETNTLSLIERYFDELERLEEGAWMETVYLYTVED